MLVIPQAAVPLPLSPGAPVPGAPVPGSDGVDAEVVGCGMQPSAVHGGAVVEGLRHSGCSDPGKHVTGVPGPVGIGNGTPVSGAVLAGADR
jgi:hypothetical protein